MIGTYVREELKTNAVILWTRKKDLHCKSMDLRSCDSNITFNPFYAIALFLYPLKTSEYIWFSVFRDYIKRSVAWNGWIG